jgi:hypothetical protein
MKSNAVLVAGIRFFALLSMPLALISTAFAAENSKLIEKAAKDSQA